MIEGNQARAQISKESPIHQRLTAVRACINEAHTNLESLTTRLDPVLRADYGVEKVASAATQAPQPPVSQLYAELDLMYNQVCTLNDKFSRLMDRLEV